MDVIPLCTNFQKTYLKTLRYFYAYIFEDRIYFFGDNKAPIFGHTDKMIHQYRYVMAFTNQVSHEPIRNPILAAPQAAGY